MVTRKSQLSTFIPAPDVQITNILKQKGLSKEHWVPLKDHLQVSESEFCALIFVAAQCEN